MVFDEEGLAAADSGRKAARAQGLPFGLEAVPDESEPTLLCVREVASGGAGCIGPVVARVKATPTVAGGREAVYSVLLGGGKGEGAEGELMAIRVSTHPTRLAAPREVQAVLLLGQEEEPAGGELHGQGTCGCVLSVRVYRPYRSYMSVDDAEQITTTVGVWNSWLENTGHAT